MLFLVENCTYIYRNNQYHNFSVWFMDIFSLVFTLLKFRIPVVNGLFSHFIAQDSMIIDYTLSENIILSSLSHTYGFEPETVSINRIFQSTVLLAICHKQYWSSCNRFFWLKFVKLRFVCLFRPRRIRWNHIPLRTNTPSINNSPTK